jgi:ABC-2 type transport system ATP-binding protein
MEHVLTVQGLKKTYQGGKVALKGIDLQVMSGDFFALLGPNGAGKSTCIGIVCGLVSKTEGKVFVEGYSIDTDHSKAKLHIGVVPQEFNFDIFSKVEDILYVQAGYYGLSRKEVHDQVEFLLAKLGLLDKRGMQAITLSGGMKRRLMIARALVHKPKLLFLDEPTAGVDIELRYEMWDFLRELNASGVTIILTTHYLEEAEKLCKHIAIIAGGEIKKIGTMSGVCGERSLEEVYLEATKTK